MRTLSLAELSGFEASPATANENINGEKTSSDALTRRIERENGSILLLLQQRQERCVTFRFHSFKRDKVEGG